LNVFDGVFTPASSALVLDVLFKLGLGAVLGGAIGLEREKAGRPAGIRTHMLLVIGVVLIAEVSKHFGAPDNSRIAAQIVTGVGFLGAGTILRTGVEVKGLTTAASLWAASAIGMAISAGGAFLVIGAAATVLALFTLAVIDRLERRFVPEGHLRDVTVTLESRSKLDSLLDSLERAGLRVEGVRVLEQDEAFRVQIGAFGSASDLTRACITSEGVLEVR
jgi:putative Mg2+ transporter-C (MgtC) family protein